MQDRSQNKRNVLVGPTLPVPVSPIWSYYDVWNVASVQAKSWDIIIPPDGMVYKLANYSHGMIPTGWIVSAIFLNSDIIWYQYEGWTQQWSPSVANAPKFEYPDIIRVTIAHVYSSYNVNHYWEMDFWRELKR